MPRSKSLPRSPFLVCLAALRRPARLLSVLAGGLLTALAPSPLHAYTPSYYLENILQPSSLNYTNPSNAKPIVVTGLNSSTGRVVGYYSTETKVRQTTTYAVQAFAYDEWGYALDVAGAVGTPNSIATCVNELGVVGGVAWANPSFGSPVQQGFLWDGTQATTILSPEGGGIDSLVAVNASGQAVGTYYSDNFGYLRAFFWDGTQSLDLGDLGDPNTAYVWPVSLNDAGQVAGMVYAFDGSLNGGMVSVAFQWEGGTLTPVDGSTVTGMNSLGQITGTNPVQLSTMPNGSPVDAGFFDSGGTTTDLGSLSKAQKGTFPFSIDEAGRITGTSYAQDDTLHLFGWQAGAGISDQGAARLNTGDTNFQLLGVNGRGDAAGLVTDANGNTQVFVRGGRTGALVPLAATTGGALDFIPLGGAGSGSTVLINAKGYLVCAGHNAAGTPVVLMLTADLDGNGLPDGWEKQYLGYTGNNPSADDDGDGISNLQEFQNGTDPGDFFNGAPPVLTLVSGDAQTGAPASFLAAPLVVQVRNAAGQALANAPVTFSSDKMGVVLQSVGGATGGAVRTDATGKASVRLRLPNTPYDTVPVKAVAASRTQTRQVNFTETVYDGTGVYNTPAAPSNLVAQGNPDLSVDLSWTNNSTGTDPIKVEVWNPATSQWDLVATLPAGTTSYQIPAVLP